jgi:tetratricopeptide (TPR) repeat protein
MNDPASELCDDGRMQVVLTAAEADAADGFAAVEGLLREYPCDHRLHFLKGSLLIGLKRFIAAHRALSQALEIAPDYHLARFQLGLFELTSGEADTALQTWQPLDALPSAHWMRLFVDGLRHLAEDRFPECIASLRAGIAANDENLPLNADMQLIVAECERLRGAEEDGANDVADGAEMSATSFLLGGTTGGRRR